MMNADAALGGARRSQFWCLACGAQYVVFPCIICAGNVARAERLRIELGTRLRYLGAAPRVEGHARTFLWTSLRIELHRRFSRDMGAPPKALLDWVSREAAYCLDAPEEMPAGACFHEDLPWAADDEDPDPFVVSQITVRREPELVSPSEPRALDNVPP